MILNFYYSVFEENLTCGRMKNQKQVVFENLHFSKEKADDGNLKNSTLHNKKNRIKFCKVFK